MSDRLIRILESTHAEAMAIAVNQLELRAGQELLIPVCRLIFDLGRKKFRKNRRESLAWVLA